MTRLSVIILLVSIIAVSLAEPIRSTKHGIQKVKIAGDPDPIKDCEHCAEDIIKAIEDCSDIPPDDEHALLKCIEDALITTADCIECICEILATIVGADIAPCQPNGNK